MNLEAIFILLFKSVECVAFSQRLARVYAPFNLGVARTLRQDSKTFDCSFCKVNSILIAFGKRESQHQKREREALPRLAVLDSRVSSSFLSYELLPNVHFIFRRSLQNLDSELGVDLFQESQWRERKAITDSELSLSYERMPRSSPPFLGRFEKRSCFSSSFFTNSIFPFHPSHHLLHNLRT